MAEPESDYSWVFGLVVLFFIFVLPILKKVADALSGKKEQQSRPAGQQREPQKRGALGEMLDEVEGYFRKARTGQEEKPKPVSGGTGGSGREYAEFDVQYRDRKREVEERRQRKEEKRERKQLETAWRQEPARVERERTGQPLAASGLREPVLKPVIKSSMKPLGTIGGGQGRERIATLAEEKKTEEKEEDFFSVFGELPEMARMIVLSEVFSQPKSMRSAGEGI